MTNYHQSPSGRWLRCVASSSESCHYDGGKQIHGGGYAGIAANGGGITRTNGKAVQILPHGDGYLTVAENGQVSVYGEDGEPIPYAKRRGEGWDKEAALADGSEERIRLRKEIQDALIADAAITAGRQAKRTQAWKLLSEEIGLKSQEYADAHFGEAYAYGSDEELDRLHDQRWALMAEKAPAGYSRELAEAEGADEEDLAEIDRENAKAQAVADRIREEQEALAAKVGARQLTSSQRRLRGWIATKGSKAGRNLAKAMGGKAQAAGEFVAADARNEVNRFKREADAEVKKFERELAKEFGMPVAEASGSQLDLLSSSPSPQVSRAAKVEKATRKVKVPPDPKPTAGPASEEIEDFLTDFFELDGKAEKDEDLWGLGDGGDLFDGFDS